MQRKDRPNSKVADHLARDGERPVSYTHLDVYKRQVVRVCDLCQRSKVVNYRVEGEMNYIKVKRPFDLVAVDLYGPLPCLLYTSRCV